MFDSELLELVDLPVGDAGFDSDLEEFCYQLTCELLSSDWVVEERCGLPSDLESIPPGLLLAVILSALDLSRMNGFDLVRLVQARERLIAHHQAAQFSEMVEMAYSTPGDADSDPGRLDEIFEFGSDELRAALHLTRRAAESKLGMALDLTGRCPRVWEWLERGEIDLGRVRVILDGTAHLDSEAAGRVVDEITGVVSGFTAGQLRARIARLCIEADPDQAEKRQTRAYDERRLWIEATVDGTAHLHLLDIAVEDARAIGRRVNAHMISLQTTGSNGGDTRSHDQLRADICVDMLLGSDPTLKGRGLVDVRVDLNTLSGLDERSAEIPGMGPVIAEVARRIADRQHRAEWRFVVTDHQGRLVDIVTPSRRPTQSLSRHVQALHPTCSFPGCRMPASDCDLDHLDPRSHGGETSLTNLGPKCRHDHRLKDHGWTHQHQDGENIWTSPLGHTYITQGQSP